jgi:hypothetical protein
MSHHRFPICQITGKVRYREPKDVKLALRRASQDRSRARFHQAACSRREIDGYRCSDCDGWHLTSKSARSARPVPAALFTSHTAVPAGPAAEAMRRMATATGLTAPQPET